MDKANRQHAFSPLPTRPRLVLAVYPALLNMLLADEVKQAIEQLENVTGIKLREAMQELNNYLAGRKEISNGMVVVKKHE